MHCVLTIQYRVKFLIAAFVPDRSTLRYSFSNINDSLSFFAYGANFKYNNEEISSVLIRWHDTLTFNIVLVSSRYLSCLVYNSNILSLREIILTNLLCSQTCSLRSFSRTLSLTYLNLALVWILPTVDAESAAFFLLSPIRTYFTEKKGDSRRLWSFRSPFTCYKQAILSIRYPILLHIDRWRNFISFKGFICPFL